MGEVTLTLATTQHAGKRFGAGPCAVNLGLGPMKLVAVLAGAEKWVTVAEHARAWLTERGCPAGLADEILAAVFEP